MHLLESNFADRLEQMNVTNVTNMKKLSQIASKPYHKESPSHTLQESVIKVEIG